MTRAYSDVNLAPTAGSGVLLQNVPLIIYYVFYLLENRPTNARCPDKKKVSLALWYSRITQINHRSMQHVGEQKHELDRTTVCIEFVGQCFSHFFQGFFFWGGGGELKLRSNCRQCYRNYWTVLSQLGTLFQFFFRLPYLSRKYAFSGFEKQLHKKIRDRFSPNLVQWCILQLDRFKENLAFVTLKMRIQEVFFPLHTADAYANVPNCDVLTCTLF